MSYTLDYEVDAELMKLAQQLAVRLARDKENKKALWSTVGVTVGVAAGLCAKFFQFDLAALLGGMLLGVVLMTAALLFKQRAALRRTLAHLRRCTLILDDEGLRLCSAVSETRYPWREVRDVLPLRGGLAIVLTPVPLILPIPDSAFADAAARQYLTDALRAGMSRQRTGDEQGREADAKPAAGKKARSREVFAPALGSAFSSVLADQRSTMRMLFFCVPHVGDSTPNAYKCLLCLLLYGLFALSAQIAQYWFSGNAGGGMLLLAALVGAILLACAARVLGKAADNPDALRTWHVLCLTTLCLPWVCVWIWNIGLLEWLTRFLEMPVAQIFSAVWPFVVIWLICVCAFQFPHRAAPPCYRSLVPLVFVLLVLCCLIEFYRDGFPMQARAEGNEFADAAYLEVNEAVLYGQSRLLAEHLLKVRPGVKGKPELFFLGLGGADQDVFLRETQFVEGLMRELFATEGHSLILVNHARTAQTYPMANLESLRRALRRIGEQMNGAEDTLFLFLTSHGSRDFRLSLSFFPFSFTDISPAMLRQALDDSGIERRVVVVSACYSGGFIPALQDDNTLVITAAAADRSSFGCGEGDELTEFGRAYFDEALRQSRSIEAAFHLAAARLAKTEQADDIPASLPQIVGGNAALRAQLQALGAGR
jgi:hypothetical protein